jgi:SWI/SNF-related matrix-associated actin-dependent regulator of chromatin subfamily D
MNPPEQKLPKFVLCLRRISTTHASAFTVSKSRKRKLNDRTLPASILSDPQLSVDSQMYQDLLEMEKKLDWTIMRKKAEVQDALGRTASVSASLLPPPPSCVSAQTICSAQTTRTLRLFLSHTVSGQPWQSETSSSGTAEAPNFETGQGIPAWQLKIEGRLLEVSQTCVVATTCLQVPI